MEVTAELINKHIKSIKPIYSFIMIYLLYVFLTALSISHLNLVDSSSGVKLLLLNIEVPTNPLLLWFFPISIILSQFYFYSVYFETWMLLKRYKFSYRQNKYSLEDIDPWIPKYQYFLNLDKFERKKLKKYSILIYISNFAMYWTFPLAVGAIASKYMFMNDKTDIMWLIIVIIFLTLNSFLFKKKLFQNNKNTLLFIKHFSLPTLVCFIFVVLSGFSEKNMPNIKMLYSRNGFIKYYYNKITNREIDLKFRDIYKSKFVNKDLRGVNLYYSNIEDSKFINSNLSYGNLDLTVFTNSIFKEIILKKIEAKNASFQGAILWSANLEEANLYRANFKGADLFKANLKGANLWLANLQGVDLTLAKLQGANLDLTDLQGAILYMANFEKAKLVNTNLQGAYLDGSDISKDQLENAIIDKLTILPYRFVPTSLSNMEYSRQVYKDLEKRAKKYTLTR